MQKVGLKSCQAIFDVVIDDIILKPPTLPLIVLVAGLGVKCLIVP